MTVSEVAGGTLGEVNIGANVAVGFLAPMGAQLDAMLALGLGPLQADLGVQFNAAIGAQATLTLQIGNPLASLQLALAAVAQLQAALSAALALPPVSLSLSAELGASVALSGALSAKLGLIQGLIDASLKVKIPAIKAGVGLAASLSAGPIICLSFDGISDSTTLAATGSQIQSKFASGVSFGGNSIGPGETVSGVILVTKSPSAFAALGAIITV